MERPKIADQFPDDTTISDLQKKFQDNPELYRYIVALDTYIDHLEEEASKAVVSVSTDHPQLITRP